MATTVVKRAAGDFTWNGPQPKSLVRRLIFRIPGMQGPPGIAAGHLGGRNATMTRFNQLRQRREMQRRIRAVVAERRLNRIAPIGDEDDEPTVELRPVDDAVTCGGAAS